MHNIKDFLETASNFCKHVQNEMLIVSADIDECTEDDNGICDDGDDGPVGVVHGMCENLIGSHSCYCVDGYEWDGTVCRGKN